MVDDANGCEFGRRIKDHFEMECVNVEKTFKQVEKEMTDLKKILERTDQNFRWIVGIVIGQLALASTYMLAHLFK